ncbi:MAG: ABC transporter ATP-binding protein, partial [Miltoncostaeaceae bacterium]
RRRLKAVLALERVDQGVQGRAKVQLADIEGLLAFGRIAVIDHGRIVERGTHDELVAAGGWYAQASAPQTAEALRERPSRA